MVPRSIGPIAVTYESPPYCLLGIILFAFTFAALLHFGFKINYLSGYFLWKLAFQNAGVFNLDLVLGDFARETASLFARHAWPILDVPSVHLIGGVILKVGLGGALMFLCWRVYPSILACAVGLLIFYGFAGKIYLILNLGPISHEIREPAYFSYRQLTTILCVLSMGHFLARKNFICGVLLAAAFYIHPKNTVGFFLSYTMVFILSLLVFTEWRKLTKEFAAMLLTFVALISPYVVRTWVPQAASDQLTHLSSSQWWSLILDINPDDVSILWWLETGHLSFLMWRLLVTPLVVALFLGVAKAQRPVTLRTTAAVLRGPEGRTLLLLVSPVIVSLLAATWEAILIAAVPDLLNDLFIPLELRVTVQVSAILSCAVLAGLMASWMLAIAERLLIHRRSGDTDRSGNPPMMQQTRRLDGILALVMTCATVAGLLLMTAMHHPSRFGDRLREIKLYFNSKPQKAEYFASEGLEEGGIVLYGNTDNEDKRIPFAPYLDVCRWIRGNVPISGAFFVPGYLEGFRVYSERQALDDDVNAQLGLYSRKLAEKHLQHFQDLHKGQSRLDLISSDPFLLPARNRLSQMRKRFLSLDRSGIEKLKSLYPGYCYLLTERGHDLPYLSLYENDYFRVFDLQCHVDGSEGLM
jgi:hypothetical protein